ncbi:AMP-binding protein [Lactococcus cremoris]|uniref:AMP-binding protein n=1 Tax=Lactococcus lactis subsp. cremoris TaxID=1359 RepID=UPI001E63C062|nr:AMP-binding protein [Lactococcus cremoris]MCD6632215.1 AMP-binding protein [Lactococcus cremoris]
MEHKNQFNFSHLVSLYADKTALIIGPDSYTYQQLGTMIKKSAQKYKNSFKKILIVKNENIINFITEFFAIIESGNYPLVIDSFTPKTNIDNHALPDNTFFLAATSGTTGQPKIYLRDWLSWKSGFETINDLFQLKKIESLATTSPMTTSLGLHSLVCSLYLGKSFLPITSPSQFGKIKKSWALFTVPTYLLNIFNELSALSSLNTLFLSGGTLSPETIDKIKNQLPLTKMIEFYGSSETSFISWQFVENGKKTAVVGKLFPHTQVEFDDNHSIIVKSPYLFSGYLNQASPQSWTTDDLGTIKNDTLYLFGRRADIIEHGANKIFPEEIEQFVKDLCQECAAFGISDQKYGQKIALLVVKPLEKELVKERLNQELPKYKRPQIYLEAETLSLTSNQKLSRKELEQNYFKGIYHDF